MKIFNAEQIRQWDQSTIAEQSISQEKLMGRAAGACVQWLMKRFAKSTRLYILCGNGGNGGDGLAIAKEMLGAGYPVTLLFSNPPTRFKGATLAQWEELKLQFPKKAEKVIVATESTNALPAFSAAEPLIIIDALLGTGYRPDTDLNQTTSQLIKLINEADAPIIAIDLPSGLAPDSLPSKIEGGKQHITEATHTLTFQGYKRSFLYPESAKYIGAVHVLDIGLSTDFAAKETTDIFTTTGQEAAGIYRPRTKNSFSHKGSFGTAVFVGGSYGKIGAVGLSAKAALRTGVGKVFIQAPKCGYEILQTSIPEAMFDPAGDSYVSEIVPVDKATYGIGPGMDTHPESIHALKAFLKERNEPLVLDADALNIIATDTEAILTLLPKYSILTPHPGEFKRLFGDCGDSMQQVEMAKTQAQHYGLIIVLKGHHTAVCTPDGKVRYNMTGNVGMATAGSGDVLTGVITSLLAQGYAPADAATLGVYLHGLAGDLYSKNAAPEALIAQDLIDYLPNAYKKLLKKQSHPFY